MIALPNRRVFFLISLLVGIHAALPAQTEAKGFALSGGLELNPFSGMGVGGILAAEYRFTDRIGAGIRYNTTYMLFGQVSFEFTLFGRWYFKPFGKKQSQFVLDLSGSAALPILRGNVAHVTPSFNILGAWRLPLGQRWFLEPYMRASYPFIFTAGAMLGYRFPARESIVFKEAPPLPPEPPKPEPPKQGVYVGILSFGPYAEEKTPGFVYLDETGYQTLSDILDNSYGRNAARGTSLYYAVHSALARLETNTRDFPVDIASVSIITFTDGIDNNSTSSALTPLEGRSFSLTNDYRDYIKQELAFRMIAGQPISAFSVGIRGNDVGNSAEFTASLNALSSEEGNAYEVDYSQLNVQLAEIANTLTERFTEDQFVLTTPSYAEDTVLRLTFDIPETENPDLSTSYIEGTVTRAGNGYELSGIAYAGSIASAIARGGRVAGALNGTEVAYTFPNFTGYDPLSSTLRQWVRGSDGAWHGNSEYSAKTAVKVSDERKSAVVYLVLDASSSLSDTDLRVVRESAREFIRTLLTGKPTPSHYVAPTAPVVEEPEEPPPPPPPPPPPVILHNPLEKLPNYMALIRGNLRFPTGIDDSGTALVGKNFLLAKSEVTYELWEDVRDWATSAERGAGRYTFVNNGAQGAGAAVDAQHPVTTISWYDALVWCNALTEYMNKTTESAFTPAYRDDDGVVRDAGKGGGIMLLPVGNADGFRLPTSVEWEFAARWRGADTIYTVSKNDWANSSIRFTQGDAASGATASYTNNAATGVVAVSSASGTASVKSRRPNALGLYDMSGNVWEWNFDAKGASRAVRGGSWGLDTNNLSIGGVLFRAPTDTRDTIGFRLARNAPD
jgi:hypothetical protein